MAVDGLPLSLGASGEPVADLQRRLLNAGFPADDPPGCYGPATAAAISAFQAARGLRADGVCGEQTWGAVVEAGYRLGDRRLYQRKPMTRGDDVAELQRRLSALGFDSGKVDGIFGPDTASAVADFQRNAGLTVDGIFGPDELVVLGRFGNRGEAKVAELRELAALRIGPRSLEELRVVIGERGGLDGAAAALGRALRRRGADAVVVHHPDGGQLAQQANVAHAGLFLELAALGAGDEGCRCAYYQGYHTVSPAGRALAEALSSAAAGALGVPDLGCEGMAIPQLRETRMPAVVCEVGPTSALVSGAPALVTAATGAIERWALPGT